MSFRKYDHLERLGHIDTDGILDGTVYVFPKLDGTNASAWYDPEEGRIRCASRNREVTPEDDNAGFAAWVHSDDTTARNMRTALAYHPGLRVYGEWLVPHSFKGYREDAWRRFWVFDAWSPKEGAYVHWDALAIGLGALDLVQPICKIENPTEDDILRQVEAATFLVEDGKGPGEGVVVKNYAWANKHGRQPWAKVVRQEFKEMNAKTFGVCEKTGSFQVEAAIAEEFVTGALVDKTLAKVCLQVADAKGILAEGDYQREIQDRHRGRVIPQLLQQVYHDLVTEEIWPILKKYGKKSPSINFKNLQSKVQARTKTLAPTLF